VTFSGNTATGGAGGGMNNQMLDEATDEASIPLLTNVTFSGNTANGGGGLFANHSHAVLTNVTFSGNTANIRGGAILLEGASPTFNNVTFSGNTAPAGMGGTLRNIQNAIAAPSNPIIRNSILWGNGTEEITGDGTGLITLVDSVVQGGCPASSACTNVITANPNLGALANNGGFTQTRALNVGSSAIDAGGVNFACASTDQRGVTRPQGSACDIGAYEASGVPVPTNTATNTPIPTATFTSTATLTPTFTPTVTSTNTPMPPIPAPYFEPYQIISAAGGEATGIGDFNSDGLPDVAMTTSSQLLIFLQNSNGTLAPAVPYEAGSRPEHLAVGDVNNDAKVDIVVANYNSDTLSIFIQQPAGLFASRIIYPTNDGPDAVAVDDLNSDGLADIAVSHWSSSNIGIFTQTISGTLNPMVTYTSHPAGFDEIAIADINNDNRKDVIKMNGQGLYPNLSVYLQNGSGLLDAPLSYSIANCTSFCLGGGFDIGDVTGDGLADVVLSHGGNGSTAKIAVFAQGLDGSLQPSVAYSSYDIPDPVEVEDMNRDGLIDVVVGHGGWNAVSIYMQQGNNVLGNYALYPVPNSGYNPDALAVGDINQDNLIDVVLVDNSDGLVILYQTLTPPPTATPTFAPTFTPTITAIPSPVCSPTYIIYVSPSGNNSDGCSWTNAFTTLQSALAVAANPNQVWVASGTYYPDEGAGQTNDYRPSTFALKNGVSIYGGFVGNETLLAQRNPATNVTVLSGDIGVVGNNSDNSFNVVVGHNTNNSALLDGFTITGGNANGDAPYDVGGGGIFNENGSPTLVNLIISDNFAELGGGIANLMSNPILLHLTVKNNTASYLGGGLINQVSSPTIINSTFVGNSAEYGGAILNRDSGSDPFIANVTITGNIATIQGGGLAVDSNTTVINSILWGNAGGEIFYVRSSPAVSNSIVQGGYAGTGNIDADPLLGPLQNNGGFTETMALQAGSPAIDSGTNTNCPLTDQRGVTRPQGSGCDIGAVEYDGIVWPTSTPTVLSTPPTMIVPTLPTNTPIPTSTLTPSPTSTPTDVPTDTPTPTATFTPTLTPTFTSTPTSTSTPTYTPTVTNTPVPEILYLSSNSNGTAGGVAFADEDILSHNKTTGAWAMYFDGSDVGITGDIDAFALMPDGTILISLDADGTVGSLGVVDESDIIQFTPTSLGTTTAGTFTLYFDGSDVSLTTSAEDIDSIDFAPDGRLIIGTGGSFSVTGVSGGDEDLIAFTATSLGSTTAGTWSLYFDGSDVGLNEASTEDINEIWIDPANNLIYITTLGAFSVTGVSGDGADVFVCAPGMLGTSTICTYAMYWDGSLNGFAGEVVDGLDVVK